MFPPDTTEYIIYAREVIVDLQDRKTGTAPSCLLFKREIKQLEERQMPSSVIRGFSYFDKDRALEVTLVSGKKYRYQQVPSELYRQMRESFSKGEFFNRNIRDRFEYKKLSDIS